MPLFSDGTPSPPIAMHPSNLTLSQQLPHSLAAHAANLPSILITNFTFDSVYSYLSTPLFDHPPTPHLLPPPSPYLEALNSTHDVPIPLEDLDPLVSQLYEGYRCADLLLRLPGAIPIPSFAVEPKLPSVDWVGLETRNFLPEIVRQLAQLPDSLELLPPVPYPSPSQHAKNSPKSAPPKPHRRSIHPAPLLVRLPNPPIYSPAGRTRLLDSIGVPSDFQDPEKTKILIVSFGGQVFKKPKSRSPSVGNTPGRQSPVLQLSSDGNQEGNLASLAPPPPPPLQDSGRRLNHQLNDLDRRLEDLDRVPCTHNNSRNRSSPMHPLATPSHLWIPGAPPASKPTSPTLPTSPTFNSLSPSIPSSFNAVTIPPTPPTGQTFEPPPISQIDGGGEEVMVKLLPDSSWIAVVCGVSKDWGREDGEELPLIMNDRGGILKPESILVGIWNCVRVRGFLYPIRLWCALVFIDPLDDLLNFRV
ncbi:hypothetical protein JAAARDRAFT_35687 [Jaapia argillacea MUCL 33604]|uniref:Uncharacterized protein n=1 Tax=Jaapia argillacea MUCL 33604 TaxID=933084 RepID=A0A067Q3A9_9AGAM|nr:hypothetical protein JAAARDRAFT_35687 [Jaapia argillacea MUCL 33604]